MKPLQERVKDRIRDTICRACIYRTAEGGCSLGGEENCAILDRVDKVMEIVRSIRSPTIDPYVDRLRDVMCAECRMQDERGRCKMRQHGDCALDDYFVLLVELVEQELDAEWLTRPA